MPNDLTFYIALYAAGLSTLVFLWELYKYRQERPHLIVDRPTIETRQVSYNDFQGTSSLIDIPVLSVVIRNPTDKKARVEAVYLSSSQGEKVKLEEMMALGSAARSFDVEPRDSYRFLVRGKELTETLQESGYKGGPPVVVEVEDALGHPYKSRAATLSLEKLSL